MTTFWEVRLKRARDLTADDVIWFQDSWTEVLALYADTAEMLDDLGIDGDDPRAQQVIRQARAAFDRCRDTYVVVRLWLHEESTADYVADKLLLLYRNQLVQVQAEVGAAVRAARPAVNNSVRSRA